MGYSGPIPGLSTVPRLKTNIEISVKEQVFDVQTIQLKQDGVVVEMSDRDFMRIKNSQNKGCVGIDLLVKFKPTAAQLPIEGSAYQASLVYSFRISHERFHIYLAFKGLDKTALSQLREHIAVLL